MSHYLVLLTDKEGKYKGHGLQIIEGEEKAVEYARQFLRGGDFVSLHSVTIINNPE